MTLTEQVQRYLRGNTLTGRIKARRSNNCVVVAASGVVLVFNCVGIVTREIEDEIYQNPSRDCGGRTSNAAL